MIIKAFDISFVRLKHEHIEELRQWRNSGKIRSRMEYREYISPAMQEKWFKEVDNISTYLYFVIFYKEKSIGIVHAKDWSGNTSDGGMFFWDDEFVNSHLPVLTSITFTDIHFYLWHNTEAYCRMLKNNKQAINFNTSFGYKLCPGQEANENQLYKLIFEDYEMKAPPIRSMLAKIYRNSDRTIFIELEKEDMENGVAAAFEKYYADYSGKKSPVQFQLVYR